MLIGFLEGVLIGCVDREGNVYLTYVVVGNRSTQTSLKRFVFTTGAQYPFIRRFGQQRRRKMPTCRGVASGAPALIIRHISWS